jgi:hypothetical protein
MKRREEEVRALVTVEIAWRSRPLAFHTVTVISLFIRTARITIGG